MEQISLSLTPKRKSILWNYKIDGNARVSAILTEKLTKAKEFTDDETLGLNIMENGGICIDMNSTGTKIWEQCNGVNTIGEILNNLSKEFNIKTDDLINDLEQFFKYCDSVDIIDVNWRSLE
jgi:hypothetical protein